MKKIFFILLLLCVPVWLTASNGAAISSSFNLEDKIRACNDKLVDLMVGKEESFFNFLTSMNEHKFPFTANAKKPGFPSLLGRAVEHGSLRCCKLLIKLGANVNETTTRKRERVFGSWTLGGPLHHAIRLGHYDIVTYFLKEARASVHLPDNDKPCNLDCSNNLTDSTCRLVFRPIHYAARAGSYEMVQLLLDHGARVDDISIEETPLQIAARASNAPACKALLEAGADVRAACHFSPAFTAFKDALHSKNYDTIALFLEHDVPLEKDIFIEALGSMDIQESGYGEYMHRLCTKIFDTIEKRGLDPSQYLSTRILYNAITLPLYTLFTDKGVEPDETVFHEMIKKGSHEVVAKLIGQYRDEVKKLDMKEHWNMFHDHRVMHLLLAHGLCASQIVPECGWSAAVRHFGACGKNRTLLHVAFRDKKHKVAMLLILHGAALNARDDEGEEPLKLENTSGEKGLEGLIKEYEETINTKEKYIETIMALPVRSENERENTLSFHNESLNKDRKRLLETKKSLERLKKMYAFLPCVIQIRNNPQELEALLAASNAPEKWKTLVRACVQEHLLSASSSTSAAAAAYIP